MILALWKRAEQRPRVMALACMPAMDAPPTSWGGHHR
jgi:hypothetical protein